MKNFKKIAERLATAIESGKVHISLSVIGLGQDATEIDNGENSAAPEELYKKATDNSPVNSNATIQADHIELCSIPVDAAYRPKTFGVRMQASTDACHSSLLDRIKNGQPPYVLTKQAMDELDRIFLMKRVKFSQGDEGIVTGIFRDKEGRPRVQVRLDNGDVTNFFVWEVPVPEGEAEANAADIKQTADPEFDEAANGDADFILTFSSPVRLSKSGEKGEVIGIAEYSRSPMLFQVEYVAADGRQVKDWFERQALAYGHTEAEAIENIAMRGHSPEQDEEAASSASEACATYKQEHKLHLDYANKLSDLWLQRAVVSEDGFSGIVTDVFLGDDLRPRAKVQKGKGIRVFDLAFLRDTVG